MLELLAYLRANGFKTFIVSGGGIEFMRPWTEKVYGIPPEQVIGSSGGLKYRASKDGRPVLIKLAEPRPQGRQGRQARRHPAAHRPPPDRGLRQLRRRPADAASGPATAPGPRFVPVRAPHGWRRANGPTTADRTSARSTRASTRRKSRGWTVVQHQGRLEQGLRVRVKAEVKEKRSFGYKWIAVALIAVAAAAGVFAAVVLRQADSPPQAASMAEAVAPASVRSRPRSQMIRSRPGLRPKAWSGFPAASSRWARSIRPAWTPTRWACTRRRTRARSIACTSTGSGWTRPKSPTRSSRAFVKATGYVTIAERTPTAEEFPDAPPENLVAGSVVFTPPTQPVPLDNHFRWWRYEQGASWRHPEGPAATSRAASNIPSSTSPTTTPSPTRSGPANASRPRRSGNSRRAAGSTGQVYTPGATSSRRTASGWRTLYQGHVSR